MSVTESGHQTPVTVLEARPENVRETLRAVWRYRGFYGFLAREILMRKARGTLLGIWWIILRPLIPAVGLLTTFMAIAPVTTSHDLPYPIFFLSGYIPWRIFQGSLTTLPRALIWTRGIMQRTYFPRILVPLAGVTPVAIEFALLTTVFTIVSVASVHNGGPMPVRFGWPLLWLLPALLGSLMFALAFGMVIAIVALFFRDIVFSVGWVGNAVMFATPVVSELSSVPERYRWYLHLVNPMAEMVLLFRWALTGRGSVDPLLTTVAFVLIALAFSGGVTFFLRAESHLGDQL